MNDVSECTAKPPASQLGEDEFKGGGAEGGYLVCTNTTHKGVAMV